MCSPTLPIGGTVRQVITSRTRNEASKNQFVNLHIYDQRSVAIGND